MTREELYEEIRNNLEAHIRESHEDAEVNIQTYTKNNGVERTGLAVTGTGSNIQPVIYLDMAAKQYDSGWTVDDICENIEAVYDRSLGPDFDTESFLNYENARGNLSVCVRNAEMNAELLERVPHEMVGDLAVMYRIETGPVGADGGAGSVLVTNDVMQKLGVSEEQLKADAWASQRANHPYTFRTMKDVMIDMMGGNVPEDLQAAFDQEPVSMNILSAGDGVNGAVYMCDKEALAEVAEKLGDNLVILPSSIHECIVLRESQALDMDSLKDMVETVNATEVSPDERLSDNVYTYDAQTQELTVYTGEQQVMQQTM